MWKLKVLIQFVLSKIPAGEKINYSLQRMYKKISDEDRIKRRIVSLVHDLAKINERIPLEGATVVEIGTGWLAISPVLLYLMGAKNCHTYDHIRHVRFSLVEVLVRCVESQLDEISKMTSVPHRVLEERLSKLRNSDGLDDFLSRANIVYHAPGDASNTGLRNHSVDLVYSNRVLEYIPKEMIYQLTNETKRILSDCGIAFHMIGLQDDYTGVDKKINKFNHLKYSERVWSFFVHNKLAYRNRLREKQFLDIFRECGASIVWKESTMNKDDIDILKNMKIDKSFQDMSYEELAVINTKMIMSFSS